MMFHSSEDPPRTSAMMFHSSEDPPRTSAEGVPLQRRSIAAPFKDFCDLRGPMGA